MMKTIWILAGFSLSTISFASTSFPEETSTSRALQQARRVASMENRNDIPSRAALFGHRVAKTFKVALYRAKPSKIRAKKHQKSK